MAGVAVSGLEEENFDGHEDVGDLLDRLVDNTETEESTKGYADITRPTRRVWCVRDRGSARGSREEASDESLGPGPQNGRNPSTIRRKRIQRVTKQGLMCSLQARLRSRDASSTS